MAAGGQGGDGTAIAGATAKRRQADAKLDRAMTTDSLLNQVEKGHIRTPTSNMPSSASKTASKPGSKASSKTAITTAG